MKSIKCRSCGSTETKEILDLGLQPLANNLLRPGDLGQDEPRFPLRLTICRACWLLQISDLVPPASLFSEYLYFSSNSDEMLGHARAAAERYLEEFELGPRSLVAEIASNDGYMLKNFQASGVPCLGIEPAKNIARVTQKMGIETIVDYFGAELARQRAAGGEQADLILGNNVFAHAPNTNDFVAGLRHFLKPNGRIVLEFPYAADFIEKVEFDTIYHEHVFYFSLTALRPLFVRHGLSIFHCERIRIHGGSLRLFVGRLGDYPEAPSVTALLEEEHEKGMDRMDYYCGFARRVRDLKSELSRLLNGLKSEGRSIAAYGASAKGSTLLNYFGLGRETLDFVADRSPQKQGRLTPGTHLPVLPPDQLARRKPDYTLLLTWNFKEEILRQQENYRSTGGRFIIPIPEVTVA